MASSRQIAANRRNARKSSGPRSATGKRRASRNSTRHGFSADPGMSNPERQIQIKQLGRQIAGKATDPISLELARAAAEAQFQLILIRRVQVALIDRVETLGRYKTNDQLSEQSVLRMLRSVHATGDVPPIEIARRLHKPEPGREAEAVRQILPELRKLDRFASRAITSRGRALALLSGRGAPQRYVEETAALRSD
jgi:hypothetical protein